MPTPTEDPDVWFEIAACQGKWNKLVKEARTCWILKRANARSVTAAHEKYVQMAAEAGLEIKVEPVIVRSGREKLACRSGVSEQGTHVCPTCGEVCASKTGLHSHRASKHGWRAPLHNYILADNICYACGVKYASRTKIMEHLRYSNTAKSKLTCAADLACAMIPTSDQDAAKLRSQETKRLQEAELRGHELDEHRYPCIHAWKLGFEGPFLAGAAAAVAADEVADEGEANPPIARRHRPAVDRDADEGNVLRDSACDAIHVYLQCHASDDEAAQEMAGSVCAVLEGALGAGEHAAQIAVLQYLCEEGLDSLLGDWPDLPDLKIALESELSDMLRKWQCVDDEYFAASAGSIAESCPRDKREGGTEKGQVFLLGNPYRVRDHSDPFLPPDPLGILEGQDEQGTQIDVQHYIYEHAKVAITDDSMIGRIDVFTRHIAPVRVVLNLCSGRRRQGDIQHHLEAIAPEAGLEIMMLSIDVAIHAVKCDLTNKGTIEFWTSQCLCGRVCGFLMGPPCESWTEVRFEHTEPGMPPPIRFRCKPWGVKGLKPKHYQQLGLATQLLFVGIHFTLLMARTGGFAFLEHPAPPRRHAAAPSIWFLAYTRWITEFVSGACFVRFNQGIHNQVSEKPTQLLLLRLQPLKKYLYSNQLGEDRVQQAEILCGRNEQGGFRTSRAKEYPSSLCLGIAKSIVEVLRDPATPESAISAAEPASDEAPTFCAWDSYGSYFAPLDPYEDDAEGNTMKQDCMLFNTR